MFWEECALSPHLCPPKASSDERPCGPHLPRGPEPNQIQVLNRQAMWDAGPGPFRHAGCLTRSHLLDLNVQAHRRRAEAAWCSLVPGSSLSCVTSPWPVRMLVYTRSKWAVFWSTPCEMPEHPLKLFIFQPYECDYKQRAAGAGWNICPAKKHRLYLICMMITFPVPVSESRKFSSFI